MPTIDHLPRPWLLAAMTGVPVSVLLNTESTEAEHEARRIRRPGVPLVRFEPRNHPAPKPATH